MWRRLQSTKNKLQSTNTSTYLNINRENPWLTGVHIHVGSQARIHLETFLFQFFKCRYSCSSREFRWRNLLMAVKSWWILWLRYFSTFHAFVNDAEVFISILCLCDLWLGNTILNEFDSWLMLLFGVYMLKNIKQQLFETIECTQSFSKDWISLSGTSQSDRHWRRALNNLYWGGSDLYWWKCMMENNSEKKHTTNSHIEVKIDNDIL